jgi:bifunctional DNA-binding transcriptional regulator/antitoxin component of YhaV-PrlF toxin-antitoxin module
MRVTSKGQVTIPDIPIAIRRQAGFLPNTEVDFDRNTFASAARGAR